MMIENTLYDILPFMSLVFLVICAFGNAIFVLDHYEKSQEASGNAEPIDSPIPTAFHNDVVDSWVNQYLLGLGAFDFGSFEKNPSYSLLWIYLILATFLTQITFFNMLIATMGTTYENVRETEERNLIKMTTEVYGDYAFILMRIRKINLLNDRFLYLAEKVNEEADEKVDIVSEVRKIIQTEV